MSVPGTEECADLDSRTMRMEHDHCADCGGSLEAYSTVEYPGGGFFRCYRCEWCGETGWTAAFLDGTEEYGGCIDVSD